jgi:tRNA (adenine22-N1)-methyltransferase
MYDLPPRLAAVAALVPAGQSVADIATDHALLPAWLLKRGLVPRAIGIDDKAAPLEQARARLRRRGIAVELRQGWGCQPLREGEVSTITVAGIGGELMTRILEDVPPGVKRLVLQPNTEAALVRAWLATHGWEIDAETLLRDGRWFATFTAGLGEPGASSEADFAWGRPEVHRDLPLLRARLDEVERRLRRLPLTPPVAQELGWLAEVRGRSGVG